MKYWKTKEFQILQIQWEQKLTDSGFKSIEDHKGNLSQYDSRTIAAQNMQAIREFFYKLDHYLTENKDLPVLDKDILNLFTDGTRITGPYSITRIVNRSDKTVRNIIKKYKSIILKS